MFVPKFNDKPNRLGCALFLGALLLMVFARQNISAQSTDIDNPTRFVTNEVSGFGPRNKTEYFYSFTAVPGKLQVTIDAKAAKAPDETGLIFELFDYRSEQISYAIVDPLYSATKREVKTLEIAKRQRLIMKLTVTKSIDNFRVTLAGSSVPVKRNNILLYSEEETAQNDAKSEIVEERLSFRRGQLSVFRSGTTAQVHTYLVKGVAGQPLRVDLKSRGSIARFDIIALPGSGTPFVRSLNGWAGRFPRDGEYLIQVYGLSGRTAAYTLEVTIN